MSSELNSPAPVLRFLGHARPGLKTLFQTLRFSNAGGRATIRPQLCLSGVVRWMDPGSRRRRRLLSHRI